MNSWKPYTYQFFVSIEIAEHFNCFGNEIQSNAWINCVKMELQNILLLAAFGYLGFFCLFFSSLGVLLDFTKVKSILTRPIALGIGIFSNILLLPLVSLGIEWKYNVKLCNFFSKFFFFFSFKIPSTVKLRKWLGAISWWNRHTIRPITCWN